MNRCTRTALLLVTLALPLVGCGALGGNYDFDPTDLVPADWFSGKKKLPGERKAVFPEGVPGTTRGVPPELVKGYQSAADAQEALAGSPQATVAREEPKPKAAVPAPKAQPKPKPAPAPKTATAATQSAQTPVDARWPDSTPPQGQSPRPPAG